MSQLKVNTIRHTGASSDAITLASDGTATAKITGGITQGLSNRNMITNGEMLVKQRPGDISFAHDGTRVGNVVDCFKFSMTTCDSYDCTVSHANSGPVTDAGGFSKSFKVTTGTAESAIAVSEYSYIDTRLEGWDCQRLYYGDANAKAATLSFWVKSSVTGTFGFSIYRGESTDRIINVPYAISSANTWEKKTLAIPGDTAQAVGNTNTERMRFMWTLWAGTGMTSAGASTSWTNYSGDATKFQAGHVTNTLATTAGATFELTGVQFEEGTIATDFEHTSYSDALAKCQRYYYLIGGTENSQYSITGAGHMGLNGSDKNIKTWISFPVSMRTTPSAAVVNANEFRGDCTGGAEDITFNALWAAASNHNFAWIDFSSSALSGVGNGTSCVVYARSGSNGKIGMSAEL